MGSAGHPHPPGAVLAKAAGFPHLQFVGQRLDRFDYSSPAIQTKAGDVDVPNAARRAMAARRR